MNFFFLNAEEKEISWNLLFLKGAQKLTGPEMCDPQLFFRTELLTCSAGQKPVTSLMLAMHRFKTLVCLQVMCGIPVNLVLIAPMALVYSC